MTENIPPLPELEIAPFTEQFLDQATVDRALRIIYEHRPDLFIGMAKRDQDWERDKPPNEDEGAYDDFTREFSRYTYEELSKTIKLPTLTTRTCIWLETRRRARLMFGMPI